MISVHVRYFAAARERVGKADEVLELEASATVHDLLDALVRRHPPLKTLLPHLRVAVDQTFATPQTALSDGVEVALIPPVAGGNAEPL